jgi:predicted metal-dependent peptidase
VAVAQAQQVARARGELPEGLARLVEQVLRPKVYWKEVLREFISRHARNDYSWFPPNRRFVHRGLYLPGLRSEELGDLVIAVDTSGSIGGAMLARFAAELQGMLEAFDATLTVLYHDARVQHVQTWRSSDGPLVLEPRGGGGTDHAPVFEWVERNNLQPAALVCLTDLHTHFPARAPGYPTLWCAVNNPQPRAPFGQVLPVE